MSCMGARGYALSGLLFFLFLFLARQLMLTRYLRYMIKNSLRPSVAVSNIRMWLELLLMSARFVPGQVQFNHAYLGYWLIKSKALVRRILLYHKLLSTITPMFDTIS